MRNTQKAKRAQKARYYKKHRKYNYNKYTRWTNYECELLLNHDIPDVELSKLLGRSLMALHVKRVVLNKKLKEIIIHKAILCGEVYLKMLCSL